jgi:hypothetical protein
MASIEVPLNHEKISTRSRAVDGDRFDNCGGVCGNSIEIYIVAQWEDAKQLRSTNKAERCSGVAGVRRKGIEVEVQQNTSP